MKEAAILVGGMVGLVWSVFLPGILLCSLATPNSGKAYRIAVGAATGCLVMPLAFFTIAVLLETVLSIPLILITGTFANVALAVGLRAAGGVGQASASRRSGPGEPTTDEKGVHRDPQGRSGRAQVAIVSGILFSIVALTDARAVKNDFLNWDDPDYVVDNSRVHALSGANLKWMMTTFHAGNWHPLTWLSHALDWRLWGDDPAGHHLTSVALHASNTVLVFFLVLKLLDGHARSGRLGLMATGEPRLVAAVVAAAFFGLHPLRVESVAWISERKDLLCAMFFILSLQAYLAYAMQPETVERIRLYLLSLFAFALALLSKPMAITLPLVLLLADLFPLHRLDRLGVVRALVEKLPFGLLSAGTVAIAYRSQAWGGAFIAGQDQDFASRLSNAVRATVFYLEKTALPMGLVPFYPMSARAGLIPFSDPLAWALVVALTALTAWRLLRGRPFWFVVWLTFLVTLAPVSGLIQIGAQAAADRYTYIPGLSLAAAAGLGAGWLWAGASIIRRRSLARPALLAVLGLIALWLAAATIRQIGCWKNSVALWEYVVSNFPDSPALVRTNLGTAYLAVDRIDEAIVQLQKAVEVGSDREMGVLAGNLAGAYVRKGRLQEALAEFDKAIALEPQNATTRYNRAAALSLAGERDAAIAENRKAVELNPGWAQAQNNLGALLLEKGDVEKAVGAFERAVQADPGFGAALDNLGQAYLRQGRVEKAIEQFRRAIEIRPDDPVARRNLAAALASRNEGSISSGLDPRAEEGMLR